ncbi:MAG TPA: IgGFc-binding protein, partial [Kofleriaceae bacterium]
MRNALRVGSVALLFIIACGPPSKGGGDDDDDDGSGSNPSGNSCSSDLHSVTDANGNVVQTCPDDQGCAAGQCVEACAAAAASQGSVGCDFMVATPSFLSVITPPCFAVFLANNWPKEATVTITRDGQTFDATQFGRVPNGTASEASWPGVPATGIASSDVGVFFLSHDPSSANGETPMVCPVQPAVAGSGGSSVFNGSDQATGIGTAFHIHTSFPVSAYDIEPYGGAASFLPSAELLLPTSAWGTNYVAAGPKKTGNFQNQAAGWGQVIAATDNTMVTVTPKVALPGGGTVSAAAANTPTTYMLNAGQFLQWEDTNDMAGSVIQSTQPVAFTTGSTYLCLTSATSSGGGCDSGHQLVPPVSALGSEYVAPPYATRRADMQPESIAYRFVGGADGTTLTYDPPIPTAPATINVGQVVEFESTVAFKVTSQDAMHPFFVGQYMSGCSVTSGSRSDDPTAGCLGDEEYVNILPPAQWLSSYVFFTDPTYTTTNFVVTRKASAGVFSDVTIDCLGTLTGWQPVGTSGQ